MDISDGLIQDLGHICRASELAAEIALDDIPLSNAARAAGPDWLTTCLTGGDDYELLLAVPPDRSDALKHAANRSGIPITHIGYLQPGPPEVMVRQASGEPLTLTKGGWSHF
jgi:thiamine-monophosphate kinase